MSTQKEMQNKKGMKESSSGTRKKGAFKKYEVKSVNERTGRNTSEEGVDLGSSESMDTTLESDSYS